MNSIKEKAIRHLQKHNVIVNDVHMSYFFPEIIKSLDYALEEQAKEIFKQIDKVSLLDQMCEKCNSYCCECFDELKKKYTGEDS